MKDDSDLQEIYEQARLGLKVQSMTTEELNSAITRGEISLEQTRLFGVRHLVEPSDQSETESTKPPRVPSLVPKGLLRTGIGRRYR
jgi:hypothetical protein